MQALRSLAARTPRVMAKGVSPIMFTRVPAVRMAVPICWRAAALPVRALAAKPAGAPAAAKKPAVPPAAQLKTVRSELATLLDNDVKVSDETMGADHPYNKYVAEHGLNITYESTSEEITIRKSTLGYDVKVVFTMNPDPDENEGQDDAEEGEDKDAEAGLNFSFIADVKHSDKPDSAVVRLFAVASKDGKLYFEGLSVAENEKDLAAYPAMDYDMLPSATQDKIADFMDILKIDDEFAQFVPAVAQEQERLQVLKQMTALAKFVA